MIQVVDYENKNLGRIKNHDENFLTTIKEKNLIDIYDKENNIIKLMTKEQFIEYGKQLRKEYRDKNKDKIK